MIEPTPDERTKEGTPTAQPKSPDDLLLIHEVAAEFRIGRATIRRLVKSGELRHLKVGVKALIPRWVMLEWVRDNLSTHPTPLRKPGRPRKDE